MNSGTNPRDPYSWLIANTFPKYAPKVFFLPAWAEIYETDDERKLDFDGACRFGDLIRDAYLSSHYELIELPKATVEDRASLILSAIGS